VLSRLHAVVLLVPPASQWLRLAAPAVGCWWLALAAGHLVLGLRAAVLGRVISKLAGFTIRVEVRRPTSRSLLRSAVRLGYESKRRERGSRHPMHHHQTNPANKLSKGGICG
jgi:hypothetical protein